MLVCVCVCSSKFKLICLKLLFYFILDSNDLILRQPVCPFPISFGLVSYILVLNKIR